MRYLRCLRRRRPRYPSNRRSLRHLRCRLRRRPSNRRSIRHHRRCCPSSGRGIHRLRRPSSGHSLRRLGRRHPSHGCVICRLSLSSGPRRACISLAMLGHRARRLRGLTLPGCRSFLSLLGRLYATIWRRGDDSDSPSRGWCSSTMLRHVGSSPYLLRRCRSGAWSAALPGAACSRAASSWLARPTKMGFRGEWSSSDHSIITTFLGWEASPSI